ncbi:MAG TPA: hypothetical protein VMT46_17165 [Anaerolineaceae bacterium]|nr:hypothetical protein [Anaerolineaceae bacterium]
MENAELNSLLFRNRLFFRWSEVTSVWKLSPQKEADGPSGHSYSHDAASLELAQAAAIEFLKALPPREYDISSDRTELDSLLNKYRLTFNWANPGLKWWLVGQNKGSNALCRTNPQFAKDIETAKEDAVNYIRTIYEPSFILAEGL